MSFFLVKSPLTIAIGEAIIQAGSVVELPDDAEAERLVANGTLEPAEIDPAQAEAFAQAKAAAGIPPDDVLVATPEDLVPASDVQIGDAPVAAPSEAAATPAADEINVITPKPAAGSKAPKAPKA